MLQIPQGKPNSGYFKVFVPGTTTVTVGEIIECKHPHTGKTTRGECTCILNEPWHRIPDWICYDTYGINSSELVKAFEAKFPGFFKSETIKILIVKQN